jgi:SAM-dependent methyltransferase
VRDSATSAYYARHAAERAARYEAADMRTLHALMLARCPAGGTALDVGCGSGRDVAMLCAQGREAIGVDASDAMLAEARRRHPEIGERLSMDALPALGSLGDRRFDLVCATAVLMHVGPDELFLALRRLRSLLAPAGTRLVSVPEPSAPAGQPPEDVDEHSRLFAWHEPADVRLRCERLGLVLAGEHRDADGCGRRRRWRVLVFRAAGEATGQAHA